MKNAFTLKINTKPFLKYFKTAFSNKNIEPACYKALVKVAKQIRKDTYSSVPNDTSELEQSWEIERQSHTEIDAVYNIIYAMYQHQGRRADGTHIIRNRPAGGKSFFLKDTVDRNLKKYFDLFEEEFFKNLSL